MSYELNVKPTFLHQLAALPSKYAMQILQKVELLHADPTPADPVKKRLHGVKGDLYRLRSGDYRILYTYGAGWVSIIGVDNRKDVYKHLPGTTSLPSVSAAEVAGVESIEWQRDLEAQEHDASEEPDDQAAEAALVAVEASPSDASAESPPVLVLEPATTTRSTGDEELPDIDTRLLKRLRIRASYHRTLLRCRTVSDLCAADVPTSIINAVFDGLPLAQPDYERVLEQPDLATPDVETLRRYVKGELSDLLLRLSLEQLKYVEWGLRSARPTLLKGAPGSGKTTIALRRAARLVDLLRDEGIAAPRILFTTYTKALTTTARQLLGSIARDDRSSITVQTADSVARQLLQKYDELGPLKIPSGYEEKIVQEKLREARLQVDGKARARARAGTRAGIQHLSDAYLLEELLDVIEARQLSEPESYASAVRTGRQVPLTKPQRRIIWNIYAQFVHLLAEAGYETWQQRRARAAELAQRVPRSDRYDAVIIDEAQDLNLSVMRMLVRLCASKGRLFITADACQSIYSSGFRWSDLQDEVGLRGSVRTLSRTYRSTRQIGEAAWAYLGKDAIDPEEKRRYVRRGERPQLLYAATVEDEGRMLVKLLRRAAARHRVGLGSCAVLCTSRRAAKRIAIQLSEHDVPAFFMERDDLDLERSGVKVMTLHAAKGIEFPIVALAGFFESWIVKTPKDQQAEAEAEWLARNHRTVFVGMTRAMQSLLVVLPEDTQASVRADFDPRYWSIPKRRPGRETAAVELRATRKRRNPRSRTSRGAI